MIKHIVKEVQNCDNKFCTKRKTELYVCLLGFNVRAAICQLYSDDEHEIGDKMNMK